MASIHSLPNELLIYIVEFLLDGRIDHFDPIATQDLQNIRLVSLSVSR